MPLDEFEKKACSGEILVLGLKGREGKGMLPGTKN